MSFQTQAGIDAEINTMLPSNDTGAVTAAALRQVLHDMNAATFQIAASQGLVNSVFRYGAAGDGATDDSGAFNAALAANGYVIAPPASYAITGAAVTIPAGGTLEAYPGGGMTYSGAGTLLIAPGGAFITKEYGDQHDGWLWARSTSGIRSTTQDPLGMLGRTGSFNFAFVDAADNGQASGIVNNLVSFQQFGGTAVTGAREALLGYLFQTAATSASNTFRDYVGGVLIAETSSGDGGTLGAEQGAYFGGNSQSRLNAGAAHVLNATAHEFDVYNASGCSVKWNWGINIVSFNAAQGSSNDAAIVIYSGNLAPSNGNNYGPGVGFHNGLCFAEIASTGRPPVDSGATLVGTHLETLSSFAAANGIDLRNFTFSNLAFASPGFYVDGFGNVATSVIAGYPGGTYLTLQSSQTVSSKIVIGNTSDPTIYVRANTVWFQDPTGAENFIEVAAASNAVTFFASIVNPGISGTATISKPALGSHSPDTMGSTASAVADGLVLQNTTAATSGTPAQSSPNIHLIGQGWATGAGASQTVDWIISAMPVSGASPSNTLSFNTQINGGGYANVMQLTFPSAAGNGSVALGGSLTVPSSLTLSGVEDFQLGWQINGSGQIWHMNLNSSGLLYISDKTNSVFPFQVSPATGNILMTSTTAASSVSAAALVVAGGIGVAGTSRICGTIFTASGGLQLGSPTGGDLGSGKLNVAGGIYLNNSAYTNPDYVFERHFTGRVEKYADRPRAKDYRGRLAIEELERHVATYLRFPGIGDEPTDIFERGDIALEKLEEQALYLFELNARIGHLERIAAGRG
jgi:hypothetical protein